MTKFCIKCGTSIPDGAGFCLKCGTKVVQEPVEPIYQQPYIPPPPPKSNKKIMIGAIAIVIIIILAGLLVYFYVYGNDEAKFIGTWRLESTTVILNGESSTQAGDGSTVTFNSDKTFTMTYKSYYINDEYQIYNITGTWKLEDGKLCVESSSSSANSSAVCYTYKFSNSNKKLTLNERYSSTDFTRELTEVLIKI